MGVCDGREGMEQAVDKVEAVPNEGRMKLLKTLPGLAVSAFFLWWTYARVGPNGKRGFDPTAFHQLHIVAPIWVAGVLFFSIFGYGMRCYRAYAMLRSVGARFSACSRILMTSLAANNILPLRIGDVMRIFTYASDVNTTPSVVLSTVLLEKLLDVFSLGVMFTVTTQFGLGVSPHLRTVAEVGLLVSTLGLMAMVFGAKGLQAPLQRFFDNSKSAGLKKVEHWLMLALSCISDIGIVGTLLLIFYSSIAWTCEGLLYVSFAKAVGLQSDVIGPWQAAAEANLSFLIPSSPGGIGPFELACKDALVRHGASPVASGLFGLLMHLYLLIGITAVGGIWFFAHRMQRVRRESLAVELDTLPAELP